MVCIIRQAVCDSKARLKVQESAIACVRVKVRVTREGSPYMFCTNTPNQLRYGLWILR